MENNYIGCIACMRHSSPEDVYIIGFTSKKEKDEIIDFLNDDDWYYDAIANIQEGKKTLISNDDENIGANYENMTKEDFETEIRKAWNERDEENQYIDAPLIMSIEAYEDDYDIHSAEDLIQYVNNFIEESYVDGDSSSQYIWYESNDIISFKAFKKIFDSEEDETDEED